MTKILNEILEDQPELIKDKKNLNKAVKNLEETNPKILASKEFKQYLRERIKSLIGLKQNKKSNFIFFAIPTFSFMFAVGGFLYYFDDIEFFGNNGSMIQIQNIEKVLDEDLQSDEINEILEIFEEELQQEKESINLKMMEGAFKNTKVTEEPEASSMMLKSTPDIMEDIAEEDEIFESLENDINETFDESTEIENIQMIPEGYSIEESDEASFDPQMMDSEPAMMNMFMELDFSTFCENNFGVLSGTGESEKCIVDKKECLASQFENGVCEFNEIK